MVGEVYSGNHSCLKVREKCFGEVLHFYYGGSTATSGTVIEWSSKSISLLFQIGVNYMYVHVCA